MGTFTEKQLKSAAKEMNDVLGLDPAIILKDAAGMEKGIQVATALIEEGDVFSKETKTVIAGLTPKVKDVAPKGKIKPPVEEDDDDEPVAPKGKGKTAPAPKGKKPPVEEDEEEDEDEDEPVAPKGKGKGKPEPVAPPKGKGKSKPPVEEEEDDEEEEDEDEPEDEEEEDDEPVAPKGKGKGKPAPAPAPKGKVTVEGKEEKKTFVAAAYNRVDALCDALEAKPKSIDDWSKMADKLLVKNGGTSNDKENKFTMGYFYKIAKNIDLGITLPKKG